MLIPLLQSLFGIDSSIQGFAPKLDISGIKISDISLIKVENLTIGQRVKDSGAVGTLSREPEIVLASSTGNAQVVTLPVIQEKIGAPTELAISAILPYRLQSCYTFGSEAVRSQTDDFQLADRVRFYAPKRVKPARVELTFFSGASFSLNLEFESERGGFVNDGTERSAFSIEESFLVRRFRCRLEKLRLDTPFEVPADGGQLIRIESSVFESGYHLHATHDRHPDEDHIMAFVREE